MADFAGTLNAPPELWERMFGTPQTAVQTRVEAAEGSLEDLISRISPVRTSPWRPANNREALGVPAVFKAVSLISNTTGTLSMEAWRAKVLLSSEDTPRIVIRPDPFTTPRVFWRDSAWYLARFGEAWWWTAKRDIDNAAMSLLPVNPREVMVEENPRNPFRPKITWRGEVIPNEDMTQITYLPDPGNRLRGWGPLQACGAAVSVAVEAQDWAANFFAGNPSNIWIKSEVDVDADEAAEIKERWMADYANLPKVTGPTVADVKDIGVDPDKAQLTDVRLFQNGEIALMFSMPPTLLNYAVQGSTITYQNVGQVADDFLRQCLWPMYLEPMEQAMSDLLTRQTIGRFNVNGLLRPDIKTRFETYQIGVPLGVIGVDEARQAEGLAPGGIENRPVPFAPPQAVPTSLPFENRVETRTGTVHCPDCGKLLAGLATAPFRLWCPKCKREVADTGVQMRETERSMTLREVVREVTPIHQEPSAPIINVYNPPPPANPITFAAGAITVAPPTPPPPRLVREVRRDPVTHLVTAIIDTVDVEEAS